MTDEQQVADVTRGVMLIEEAEPAHGSSLTAASVCSSSVTASAGRSEPATVWEESVGRRHTTAQTAPAQRPEAAIAPPPSQSNLSSKSVSETRTLTVPICKQMFYNYLFRYFPLDVIPLLLKLFTGLPFNKLVVRQ